MSAKKYAILLSALLVLSVATVFSISVYAEDENKMMDKKESTGAMMEKKSYPQPMVVQIGPEGRTLLRGTVKTVGTNSFVVTSWGGDWTVNISTDTKIQPSGDVTHFSVGDFVGLHGRINQNSAFTIDSTLVRNWTEKAEGQTIKKEIKEIIKSQTPRNWQGTASNVNSSGTSLTLTVDGTAYTVNVAAGAKIVNKNYLKINFSDIRDGDIVRVWGPSSDATITAYVVRDVSIPR